MELTIKISKIKKSPYDNPIINGIIGIALFLFLILAVIFSMLVIMPYEFLKYQVFGYKRIPEISENPSLIKTEKYHLILEYIEQHNDEHKIANDFLYKIVDYGDETAIFKVINEGIKTELEDIYLTPFKHEIEESILLQKVKADKDGKPTSDLIKFNTIKGTVEFIAEIGLFELDKFDDIKKEIIGYNLTENIIIKLEKASA